MQIVIITGMSGAGKTIALKTMEDMGYYSVDNMPVMLIPKFLEIVNDSVSRTNTAIGVDIRNGDGLLQLISIIDDEISKGSNCRILFLDASDDVLIKRFKETRRAHPLSVDGHVKDGISRERESLRDIKERSDYVLDTSQLNTRELRHQLERIFGENRSFKNLYITINSFGYKYGIPSDVDIVMDVRFLPNPYYVDHLKHKTGLDAEVQEYVLENSDAREYLDRLTGMIDFLIPRYIDEGKNQLVIAFGCTGGKHRSVTIAETVYNHLKDAEQYGVKVEHKDIHKT